MELNKKELNERCINDYFQNNDLNKVREYLEQGENPGYDNDALFRKAALRVTMITGTFNIIR
jgi:hypothetical protein